MTNLGCSGWILVVLFAAIVGPGPGAFGQWIRKDSNAAQQGDAADGQPFGN